MSEYMYSDLGAIDLNRANAWAKSFVASLSTPSSSTVPFQVLARTTDKAGSSGLSSVSSSNWYNSESQARKAFSDALSPGGIYGMDTEAMLVGVVGGRWTVLDVGAVPGKAAPGKPAVKPPASSEFPIVPVAVVAGIAAFLLFRKGR